MDIWAALLALWHSLAVSLGGDAVALLVTVGFAVALFAVWQVQAAFVKTEFYKQHKVLWELVDDKIASLIFLIENGDVDLTEFEQRAKEREEAGLSYVDPRMLFLIDKVQDAVNSALGVNLNFEDLLARGEHIFDEIKHADSNSIT